MKRVSVFMLIVISAALICVLNACVVNIPTFSALPSGADLLQTPTPTPTPRPRVIAIFGAEDADAFVSGVKAAAQSAGIEVDVVKGGVRALSSYAPDSEAAAIVYLSGKSQQIPAATIPVYAFAANGQSVSGEVRYLGYDGAEEAKIALASAIGYPPHLAPVRMIGLFTSQSSAAYALYSGEKTNGQVFSKQEFFADASELALTDWLKETLSGFYPGMLDAVYAETGALAVAAAETLASLGRSDVEVFSAATDAEAAAKLSQILVCVVGANESEAGVRCFTEVMKLLDGGEAQSGILLPEPIWYSPKP